MRQHNAFPKYPKPQRGPTSRGKEERGGRGRKGRRPSYKGDGREERGNGEGKEIPGKVKVSIE